MIFICFSTGGILNMIILRFVMIFFPCILSNQTHILMFALGSLTEVKEMPAEHMAENKGHCYGFELLCPLFSLATAILRSANYMQTS